MGFVRTAVPGAGIPSGYFDDDNVTFVQNKIASILSREFDSNIRVDKGSAIRVMERAVLDRVEPVPRMNQRAIMYATHDYRLHQKQLNKHWDWEENYTNSQRLHDPDGQVSRFDFQQTKLSNRLGFPKVGGTTRFYFT